MKSSFVYYIFPLQILAITPIRVYLISGFILKIVTLSLFIYFLSVITLNAMPFATTSLADDSNVALAPILSWSLHWIMVEELPAPSRKMHGLR